MKRAPGSYDGLTHMQALLLSFLRTRRDQGNTPTYQEMADHLGLVSKSGVHRITAALEERGYIRRLSNRARALEVFDSRQSVAPAALDLTSVPIDLLVAELQRRMPQAVRA